MLVLPVSRRAVVLRAPGGSHELSLAEAADPGTAAVAELLLDLAAPADGEPLNWYAMPLADLQAALLGLRRLLEGDRIVSEIRCEACGAPVDLSFSIAEYMTAHAPRRVRGAVAEDDWYRIGSVRFRFPTVADRIAASASPKPEETLRLACVQGAGPDVRRAENALRRMCPLLADLLSGVCPECRRPVSVWFDPVTFVLAEMRERAAFVYRDIHLLASAYGWSETQILELPRARRMRYVELLETGGVL